jgi:uncharacterized protein (UPF0261 family)
MKTVVIIGTLDTKSEQILYMKGRLENLGKKVLIVDTSTRGVPSPDADISNQEVAGAAGTSVEAIRNMKDRERITSLIIEGSTRIAHELLSQGRLDGVLALGGASAATLGSAVMKTLPFGVPKLILSSAAGMQAYAGRWFGTGDIMMMNTIADIVGLNGLVKNVLDRGAGAVSGMVDMNAGPLLADMLEKSGRPVVAMTEDGSSERCASYVRDSLEKKGYDVVNFHAQGISDRAMEELIEQGFFDAVVDICVVGVSDELFEGNRPGGPKRLEMAGRRGIPLVLTPCGLNQTGAGPTRKNSEKYASRPRILKLDELRMGTRLNEEELTVTARTVAEKLNKSKGPVTFIIPKRGFSGFDPPGGILHAPEEDEVFTTEVKRLLKRSIEVIEVDANLEEPAFAEALVAGFEHMMQGRR